jgi:hypothetical protein
MVISAGGSGRVIWHCYAGCSVERVRAALIRDGVPARCLRLPADDSAAALARIEDMLYGDLSHAHLRLRIAAYLSGHGEDLPRGAELADLAARCGVSLREAYKALGGKNR